MVLWRKLNDWQEFDSVSNLHGVDLDSFPFHWSNKGKDAIRKLFFNKNYFIQPEKNGLRDSTILLFLAEKANHKSFIETHFIDDISVYSTK